MTRNLPALTALAATLATAAPALAQNIADSVDCAFAGASGNSFCVLNETRLPLRLLTKPRTTIYDAPQEGAAAVREGLPTFSELIAVETRDVTYEGDNFAPGGWFGVTYVAGQAPVGYVRARDVVEWHHGLIVTYENPGLNERKPAIMFEDSPSLVATLESFETGVTTPVDFFTRLEDQDIPVGVISREPNVYVDFNESFYLMPIIGKEDVSTFTPGQNTWALKVAAATATDDGSAKGACDVTQDTTESCDEGAGSLENIDTFEIVFVVDMTLSMQPFIDAVRDSVTAVATTIRESFPGEADKIRFGIVGYRDDVSAVPAMEWTSRDFTAQGLLPAAEFAELMKSSEIVAASTDNQDFPEEVFAGLRDGIETVWSDSDNGVRLLILIGDASSHPLGAPRNTTQLTPEAIRKLAGDNRVSIAALHISRSADDAAIAEEQFRTIASFQGESENYRRIPVNDLAAGGQSLETELRDSLRRILTALLGGDIGALAGDDSGGGAGASVVAAARAAVVDYLGTEAQPPANIVAWVLDRDLGDLNKRTFNIKVMVDRAQLEELKNGVDRVLTAFRALETSAGDFFGAAQGISAGTAMDLLGITDTTRLGDSTILPSWIAYLPYKSELMAISVEEFKSAPPDERRRLEERLDRLVSAYDSILNRPTYWQALNDQAAGDAQVHFLDIKELP